MYMHCTVYCSVLHSTVHGSIDSSCLKDRKAIARAGSGLHCPDSEDCDLSQQMSCIHTNNRAEAMACLTVLQHVCQSKDLHAHSIWSCDIVLQNHARQWRASTRQRLTAVTSGRWGVMFYNSLQAKRDGRINMVTLNVTLMPRWIQ